MLAPCSFIYECHEVKHRPQSTNSPPSSTATAGAANSGQALLALPPQLAQLRWLKTLQFGLCYHAPAGIPKEWGLPGAFPSLQQ